MNRLFTSTILMTLSLMATAANPDINQILNRGMDALERQNNDQAIKWFTEAANQGNSEAQFQLALLILDAQGLDTDQDQDQAHALMNQAANEGHPAALSWIEAQSSDTDILLDIEGEEANPEDDC